MNKINIFARPQIIVRAANYLIRFEDRVVGQQWLKQFLERHLEYHIRKQKILAADRKQSQSVNDMSDYFEKVKRVMSEKILPIWMCGTKMKQTFGLAVEKPSW